jgi:hypothetical protein
MRHARAHAQRIGHPVVAAMEANWRWCYFHENYV